MCWFQGQHDDTETTRMSFKNEREIYKKEKQHLVANLEHV